MSIRGYFGINFQISRQKIKASPQGLLRADHAPPETQHAMQDPRGKPPFLLFLSSSSFKSPFVFFPFLNLIEM